MREDAIFSKTGGLATTQKGHGVSVDPRENLSFLVHSRNMAQAEKRIPIHEDTFEELGHFKGAGETWDDVISELIEARQRENRRELLERTDDDEFVPLEDG